MENKKVIILTYAQQTLRAGQLVTAEPAAFMHTDMDGEPSWSADVYAHEGTPAALAEATRLRQNSLETMSYNANTAFALKECRSLMEAIDDFERWDVSKDWLAFVEECAAMRAKGEPLRL